MTSTQKFDRIYKRLEPSFGAERAQALTETLLEFREHVAWGWNPDRCKKTPEELRKQLSSVYRWVILYVAIEIVIICLITFALIFPEKPGLDSFLLFMLLALCPICFFMINKEYAKMQKVRARLESAEAENLSGGERDLK